MLTHAFELDASGIGHLAYLVFFAVTSLWLLLTPDDPVDTAPGEQPADTVVGSRHSGALR